MGLLSNALPSYQGPYPVSTLDLELPAASPRTDFSPALLKSTGQPALKLDTTLVTLFYPANDHRKGSGARQPWLDRPLSRTAEGYARFVGRNPWLIKALIYLVGARVRLPVEADQGLAFKLDPKGKNSQGEKATPARPATAGSASALVGDELAEGDQTFPLVVFSHGLSGTRTTYSQWCGEIASHGYIVAAVEHRDGSSPVSVVRLENGEERVVDYIRAEEHLVFPPPNPPQTSLQFRSSQLLLRLAEVREALTILERLNAGNGAAIAAENRRGGEGVGKWLEGWKGRVGLEEAVMAGHSFGGATTIQALRAGATSFPFVRGIALDPWADPIPPAPSMPAFSSLTSTTSERSNPAPTTEAADGEKGQGEVPLDVKVPLLVINSEAFTVWRVHYKLVRGIVEAVEGGRGWLMTLVGSIHTTFSDLPLLLPSFLSGRSGSRITPPILGTARIVEACRELLAGEGGAGTILGQPVREGDERGARPGEGEKDEKGRKREMEGDIGSMRMHVRGRG
ncbi:hypothetical protein JCM8097_003310 [Rhodosporidiobolus ruineniae]